MSEKTGRPRARAPGFQGRSSRLAADLYGRLGIDIAFSLQEAASSDAYHIMRRHPEAWAADAMRGIPNFLAVRDKIAWSYANLGQLVSAINDGSETYTVKHRMIRMKLFKGVRTGQMSMRSFYHDARINFNETPSCFYCGFEGKLVPDHMIPRKLGGTDIMENLVPACQSCNSSKGGRDFMAWAKDYGQLPPLYLIGYYLRLVWRICGEKGLLDARLDALPPLPFSIEHLPFDFPPPRSYDDEDAENPEESPE